jgi:acetoin utilization protein AcuB
MALYDLPVSRVMTLSPRTIAIGHHVAAAWALMQQHRIRHLPVLDGDKVVGVLSDRDLRMLQSLRGVDPSDITVRETMQPTPYVVGPDTPLGEVAHTMAVRRIGSAVVMEGGEVVGIFTTTDALLVLDALATSPNALDEEAPDFEAEPVPTHH